MSLRVLALDPGERVGWATGWIKEGHHATLVSPDAPPVVTPGQVLEVDNHGIAFLKDMAVKLHEVVHDYDVVIYETWRLRPAMAKKFAGNDFPAVQFIGMVRLCAWLSPRTKIVSQGPSIKGTADKVIAAHLPDIQRRLDAMPKAHDDSHDGDALRHLAFFYFDRFMGGPNGR